MQIDPTGMIAELTAPPESPSTDPPTPSLDPAPPTPPPPPPLTPDQKQRDYNTWYNAVFGNSSEKDKAIKAIKLWWASKGWTPKTVSVGVGASRELGTGEGGKAAQVSVVYNFYNFLNPGIPTTGGITSTVGGTIPGKPGDSATGGSVGAGGIFQVSNATNEQEATGKATSFNLNIFAGNISFSIDTHTGIYTLSTSVGKGNGISGSAYTTATITGKDAVDAILGR